MGLSKIRHKMGLVAILYPSTLLDRGRIKIMGNINEQRIGYLPRIRPIVMPKDNISILINNH